MIGKRVEIEFDMGSWRRLVRLDPSVHVYVAAAGGGLANASAAMPIVVGFRHGEGHVLCTSFHNKAQVSEQERRLLRFLVLQPILARAAAESTQTAKDRQFQPGEHIFSTVDRGQTSQPFIFQAAAGQSLFYCLSWSGAARLRLIVKDPSGNIHFDRASNQPPLGCEVARAAEGGWLCEVSGAEPPHDNFPFVLTLAAGRASAATPPPPRCLLAHGIPPTTRKSDLKIPPPPPPRRPRSGR